MSRASKKLTVAEFNKKFLGKKVKLIGNTSSGDGSFVGTMVTIRQTGGNAGFMTPCSMIYISESGSWYNYKDFDWRLEVTIEDFEKSVEDLESEKSNIDSEISSIKLKIEFMKANKLKEFDEDTFKAFAILKELKKTTSDIDKAKLISKIIKG